MKTTLNLRDETMAKLRIYMAASNRSFKDQSEIINELLDVALEGVPAPESILNQIRKNNSQISKK
jgi:plasmid stability protein